MGIALAAIAKSQGVYFRKASDKLKTLEERQRGNLDCSFVVIAADVALLEPPSSENGWTGPPEKLPKVWTYQYADILGSMKW